MRTEKRPYCWEIMQCDETNPCPVRQGKMVSCWEWMQKNDQFQCQYGLCDECIVFLCQNDNPILSAGEIEQIMISRGLYQEDLVFCG